MPWAKMGRESKVTEVPLYEARLLPDGSTIVRTSLASGVKPKTFVIFAEPPLGHTMEYSHN